MESDFVRGSSSITRIELHVCYKVTYCHKVFNFAEVRARCGAIFREVAERERVVIKEMGFDGDHVHLDIVIRHTHRLCDVNKAFKGTSGRQLLAEFPVIKRRYFWRSGFWGGQAYGNSVGRDPGVIRHYVQNQGAEVREEPQNLCVAPTNTAGL